MSMISLQKAEPTLREQPKEAQRALERLLLPFGGSEFFFQPGEKPLFLLDLTLPAENELGVNFDIRLAYALVTLAKGCGVEQLCFAVKVEQQFDFQTVLSRSGYQQLQVLSGVRFLDLRTAATQKRATDTALLLDEGLFYQAALEADVIINLSKFKAAEGHLFGSALQNAMLAADFNADLDYMQQQRAMVDAYSVLSPDLTVVDGLKGEGGFQPQPSDFLLAATDAVAAEATLCAIADVDLTGVDYFQLAVQYGLGVGEPADIHLYGDDMSEIML